MLGSPDVGHKDKTFAVGQDISRLSFEGDFEQVVIEIAKKLPSTYTIAKDYILDTGSAVIGIVKI